MSVVAKIPLGGAAFIAWMGLAFGSPAPRPVHDDLGPVPATSVSLTGTVLYESDLLAMPTQIAVTNDHIVMVDGFAEHPIHVLDREGSYIAGLGSGGEGPGEFEWPRALAPTVDGEGFWVFDMELSRLTLVQPETWTSIPASARVTLPVRAPGMVTNLVRRPDGGFLAAGFFGAGRLGHFTADGTYEGASGAIPTSSIEASLSLSTVSRSIASGRSSSDSDSSCSPSFSGSRVVTRPASTPFFSARPLRSSCRTCS